ncbi:MAG: PEP-CTERM sorting domain-containing protein [Chthoniobacterales bacterium]
MGSLAFDANLDPTFPGGFAGIGNAVAFTSVQIELDNSAEAVAIDNFSAIAVPEPTSTLLLALTAIFGFGQVRPCRA